VGVGKVEGGRRIKVCWGFKRLRVPKAPERRGAARRGGQHCVDEVSWWNERNVDSFALDSEEGLCARHI
jgi:hypothetical protein